MKVTDVRLRKIQTDGRIKHSFLSHWTEAFVIHDLRVIEATQVFSLLCQANVHQMVNSRYRTSINSEMRQEIQDAVMKVYDETDEVIPDKMLHQT